MSFIVLLVTGKRSGRCEVVGASLMYTSRSQGNVVCAVLVRCYRHRLLLLALHLNTGRCLNSESGTLSPSPTTDVMLGIVNTSLYLDVCVIFFIEIEAVSNEISKVFRKR